MTAPPDTLEPATAPAAEYAALLRTVHDLRQELATTAGQQEKAADEVRRAAGDFLFELAGRVRAGADAAELLACLDRFAGAQGIEVAAPTGARVADLPLTDFEVLATSPAADPAADGTVASTTRPAVRHRGRLLRGGLVVVHRHTPPTE
jgi:hypothetical protein